MQRLSRSAQLRAPQSGESMERAEGGVVALCDALRAHMRNLLKVCSICIGRVTFASVQMICR